MSPEVALLLDAWDSIKSFIPAKERLHVAEELVRTFEDHVDISEAEPIEKKIRCCSCWGSYPY